MWCSFRNGTNNCGVSPFSALIKTRHEIGRVHIGGIIWGTAIIDAESKNIYVGSSNRLFVCIGNDGNIVWKYKLKRLPDSLIDSAAVFHPSSGLVIVPGGDGVLHGLDKKSGKIRWQFIPKNEEEKKYNQGAIVNSFEGNIQIDKRGRIYAGCDNGYLYCIDGSSGKEIWSFKTNMMIWSCGCLVHDEKYIVFGSLDRYVYMVDTATGKLVSKYKTDAEVKSSPLTYENKVIICNSNGEVYCFDISNNLLELMWMHNFDTEIYSSPALKQNILVVATMSGDIIAIDLLKRQVHWEFKGYFAPFCSSPIISNNNVIIIGSTDGKLYAFDLINKHMIGFFDTTIFYHEKDRHYRKNLNASPSMDDEGNIFIGSYDGYFYKIPSHLCSQQHISSSPNSMILHPVYIDVTKQYKFDIPNIPNAVISFVKNIDSNNKLPYDIVISSDGKYIDFIPNTIFGLDKSYNVYLKGQYYLQSDRWWKDRINLFGKTDFEVRLTISPIEYKKTPLDTMHSKSIVCWDIWDLFSTQPRVLDTYIPAAMNALGYTAIAFGFHNKSQDDPRKYFKMVLLPSLPAADTNEEFEFLIDKNKILIAEGIYYNGIIFTECKNRFELSIMGGTLPFDTFKTYMQVGENDVSLKCEYYSVASCLKIKGNGKDYKFSSDIVNKLCDPMMNVISVGSFQGKYKNVKSSSSSSAEVYINKSNIYVVFLNKHVKCIITVVEFDEDQSTLILREINDEDKLSFTRKSNKHYLILCNDEILSLLD
jgi:outer membrane protein assembly factor BamB